MERVQAWVCPNGHLETDFNRALAWHLCKLINSGSNTSPDVLSFSGALEIVKKANAVEALLNERHDILVETVVKKPWIPLCDAPKVDESELVPLSELDPEIAAELEASEHYLERSRKKRRTEEL